MASKDDPADDDRPATYQVEEIDLDMIGKRLVALAQDLQETAARLEGKHLLNDAGVTYMKNEHEEMSHTEVAIHNAETRGAFRSALKGLRQFRREYDRWERLSVEFALTQMGYSQREAAQELGVATSTINRWAQHPLVIEEYR